MGERLSALFGFLVESPNDPFLLFAIAQEYVRIGDPDSARRYFTRLRDMQPDYVALYYHLGRLEQKQGRYAEAAGVFEEGMAIAQAAGDTHALAELKAALEDVRDE